MTAPPRVLVAEADAATRAGLRLVLGRSGFQVAAEAVTADAAVESALDSRIDVALLATDLPGGGIDAARRISGGLPGACLLLLSPRPGGEELVAAVRAGAAGYVGKDIAAERLPHVLRALLDGETALPRRYTGHLAAEVRRGDARRAVVAGHISAALSDREWEVLQLLADGSSTADMARHLGISDVTVRRHVSSVLHKLGVADRAGATALLRRSGE
jgi:DNA-binding NarL/FixJ family response regulator